MTSGSFFKFVYGTSNLLLFQRDSILLPHIIVPSRSRSEGEKIYTPPSSQLDSNLNAIGKISAAPQK